MPFICKCQKIYNDKTFKFELYFDSYKSSMDCLYKEDFIVYMLFICK